MAKLLILLTWLAVCMSMTGCNTASKRASSPRLPRFESPYQPQAWEEAELGGLGLSVQEQLNKPVNLVAVDLPLTTLAEEISNQTGLVVGIEPRWSGATVTGDFRGATVETTCNAIRRQLGCEWAVTREGLMIGTAGDATVVTLRLRRITAEAAIALVETVSKSVEVIPSDGGVMLVGDPRTIRQAAAMVQKGDRGDAVTWAVQLYLVSLTRTASRDLGLDVVPAVQVAASIAGATQGVVVPGHSGLSGNVQLQGLLRAADTKSGVELLADPLMLVRDGETVAMTRGLRVPVRLSRITTTQGATTTTGNVQTFQTGLNIECKATEIGNDLCRLELKIESSDVDSVTDGLPATKAETLQTTAEVESGGVYLVGSLRRESRRDDVTQWLQWGNVHRRDGSVMQVWCRAYRIAVQEKGI